MRIGIVGRSADMMRQALALAEGAGHDARGTLVDEEALAWVRGGQIAALVIGGGIDPASRAVLVAACEESGVRPVLVSGPGVLGEALRGLAA